MKGIIIVASIFLLAAGPASAQEEEPAPAAPAVDPEELEEAKETAAAALKAAEEAKLAAQGAQAAADAATEELEALKAEQEKKEQKKKKKKKDEEEGKTYKGALKQDPGLKIGARLFVMWSLTSDKSDPIHEFEVNMARLKLTWSQWKLVEAVLKLDVDHLVMDASTAAILRDVYVRIQPFPWLGLRVGQFKKPFSKIELTSRRRLPFITRGKTNGWIAEDLAFGDRDIGLMLEGRIWEKIRLDYMIGVFNGAGMNVRELDLTARKDLVFRLETRPVKWLSFGANASLKFIEKEDLDLFSRGADLTAEYHDDWVTLGLDTDFEEYARDRFRDEHSWMTGVAWMTGVDVLIRIQKMRILVENLFGESWWFRSEDYSYSWSLVLSLSYKWKIAREWKIWLEPALRGEMITLLPGPGRWSARMWQIVPGVNLHLGRHVRVMVHGDFVITEDDEPDESTGDGLWPGEWPGPWRDTARLMVQLAFSI